MPAFWQRAVRAQAAAYDSPSTGGVIAAVVGSAGIDRKDEDIEGCDRANLVEPIRADDVRQLALQYLDMTWRSPDIAREIHSRHSPRDGSSWARCATAEGAPEHGEFIGKRHQAKDAAD
jgi:hypothetical protein